MGDQKVLLDDWTVKVIRQTGMRVFAVSSGKKEDIFAMRRLLEKVRRSCSLSL